MLHSDLEAKGVAIEVDAALDVIHTKVGLQLRHAATVLPEEARVTARTFT